jgi:hypothetical protein
MTVPGRNGLIANSSDFDSTLGRNPTSARLLGGSCVKQPNWKMSDNAEPKSNSDRILKHIKGGSLAARLVLAHRVRGEADHAEGMKNVLRERLKEVKAKIDGGEA